MPGNSFIELIYKNFMHKTFILLFMHY